MLALTTLGANWNFVPPEKPGVWHSLQPATVTRYAPYFVGPLCRAVALDPRFWAHP